MVLFDSICYIIGLITFISYLIKFLSPIVCKLLIKQKDLNFYYYKNTWAIITGGSDGIGKAFAEKIAASGFNICILARNSKKTELVLENLKKINSKIQTKMIICDFIESATPLFFDNILSKLNELEDIGILVNNVGLGNSGSFQDSTIDELKNVLIVNTFQILLMTKILMNKFNARKKKSLIINLSSFTAESPLPFVSLYSATKAFDDYLSQGISVELEKKIDIISLKPMFVSTPMTGLRTGFDTVSADKCVEGLLQDIGIFYTSYGHWKHHIIAMLLKIILQFDFIKNVIFRVFGKFIVELELIKKKNN